MFRGHEGTVLEFDGPSGLGSIAGADGRRWPFHCVSIADGTREIEVGAAVVFDIGFCTLRREAVAIRSARS